MDTTVRPVEQPAVQEEEFGRDLGLMKEVVVTGRKVGAGREFWSKLAHDEQLFREAVTLVLGDPSQYQPTTSQQHAAEIMGRNYHGPDQVAKHFGVRYRDAELAQLAEVPFSEDELRACKDTHILVAGYPLTGLEIRKRMKKNAYKQDWYENQDFARKTKVRLRWLLLRKTDVPNSRSKTYDEQLALLGPDEEFSIFCEVLFGMNLHFAETGERMHETYYVRCQDVTSDGNRVYVGRFGQSGWDVHGDWDVNRVSYIGLSSSRK